MIKLDAPVIRLWVKDKVSGHVHEVGTDRHDALTVWGGQLVYENLQNGDSTLDGYEFCNAKGETALFPNAPDGTGYEYMENYVLIGHTAYTGTEEET